MISCPHAELRGFLCVFCNNAVIKLLSYVLNVSVSNKREPAFKKPDSLIILRVFSFSDSAPDSICFAPDINHPQTAMAYQNRPENDFPGRRMDDICRNYTEFLMGQCIKSELHAYPSDNHKCTFQGPAWFSVRIRTLMQRNA